MKTRTIPTNEYPVWHCNVGGVNYAYPSGTEQSVPDEVAGVIDSLNGLVPTPKDGNPDRWESYTQGGWQMIKAGNGGGGSCGCHGHIYAVVSETATPRTYDGETHNGFNLLHADTNEPVTADEFAASGYSLTYLEPSTNSYYTEFYSIMIPRCFGYQSGRYICQTEGLWYSPILGSDREQLTTKEGVIYWLADEKILFIPAQE